MVEMKVGSLVEMMVAMKVYMKVKKLEYALGKRLVGVWEYM